MPASFVFDQNKCTGCQACQLACVIENRLEPDRSWRAIHTFNARHYPGAPLFHISLACNHCAEPACMSACPALAYSKDSETGVVLLDQDKCIGCRYCTWACPYDAPKFTSAAGVVSKCTFCQQRLTVGLEPACVDLCPTGALTFENLAQQDITNDVAGFTASNMQPSIKIIPLLDTRLIPDLAAQESEVTRVSGAEQIASRISLRSEWSLALFTLLAAGMFALLFAAVIAPIQPAGLLFPILAVAALGLAAAHLGKQRRALRAALNVAQSWLSREAVSFALFAGVGTAYFWFAPDSRLVGWVALLLGVGMVISADRVYKFALKPHASVPHSAAVALTGLFLGGVLAQHPVSLALAGGLKLFLYLWRKSHFARTGFPVRPGVSTIRISLGFALPVLLWSLQSEWATGLLLACVLVAELIDRLEYYAEVEIMTPARQMALDLENWPRHAVAQPTSG